MDAEYGVRDYTVSYTHLLRSIWWYVHLSWQGDMQTTAKVLEAPCFTTDSILTVSYTHLDVYKRQD